MGCMYSLLICGSRIVGVLVGFMYSLVICGSRIVVVLVWGLCIHY